MLRFTGEPDWSYDWPSIDRVLGERGEEFVFKTELLRERGEEERVSFVLSSRALYQVMDGGKGFRRTDLTSLYAVSADPLAASAFVVFVYSPSKVRSHQALGAVGVNNAMRHDAFLTRRHFTCESEEECETVVEALELLLRERWQAALEEAVVRPGETCLLHEQCVKLNRKMRGQDRIAVLSDRWLYNVEPARTDEGARFTEKSMRWAAPIEALKAVTLTRSKDGVDLGPACSIFFDMDVLRARMDRMHAGTKRDDLNDMHTFAFRTQDDRDRFVAELARIFFVVVNVGRAKDDPKAPRRLFVDARNDVNSAEIAARRVSVMAASVRGGTLSKFTGGGKGHHEKHVRLMSDGTIQWADQEGGKYQVAQVVAAADHVTELKGRKAPLTADERERIFLVQTTGKSLLFEAASAEDAAGWVGDIHKLIGR